MSACPSGKVGYPSVRAACAKAQHIRHQSKKRLRAYECPWCAGWHLTSQKGAPAIAWRGR
jgi:hypothetical protein